MGWLVVKSGSHLLERGRGSRPLRSLPAPFQTLWKSSRRDGATEPFSSNPVNGLLFLCGSTIVAPLTSAGAPAGKEVPFGARGAFHAGLSAGSGLGSPLGKDGDPDPARPPHPGLAVRGRRESCS